MAIWKDSTPAPKANEPVHIDPPRPAAAAEPAPIPAPAQPRAADTGARESVIASDLTIEGKIEGSGHVRIAGRFKGDIKVQGNLTVDKGAKVTAGAISASKVALAGDLEGNISGAQQVELLATGAITGDVKAGSLTVAPGSRIRGHVECGWGKEGAPAVRPEGGSTA